ncbi:unnamed protein product [Parnassius apollo]|uniref:(apollo) hypothetical protein n=1 Tax=Parnassius apollo TaxID=110799 RepID=A0A8S3XWP8_PARAO|nr:unnamed protein product [Parnassius apollo]
MEIRQNRVREPPPADYPGARGALAAPLRDGAVHYHFDPVRAEWALHASHSRDILTVTPNLVATASTR